MAHREKPLQHNRFFNFHFLLPFIIAAIVIIHLLFLHQTGSSNPMGLNKHIDKIPFHPYSSIKYSYCRVYHLNYNSRSGCLWAWIQCYLVQNPREATLHFIVYAQKSILDTKMNICIRKYTLCPLRLSKSHIY